ncbi:hypothetical protein EBN03_01515 [Nocardia stercoris]|uniref:Uncharacterized protein n=1 Tax=Nocardia stercoris TaxID=2483361 RepID=A0A3M2LBW5_9NOCA|nr:hypothetical protein EBN03_01515 [Nocardia stercoris]
MGPVSTDVALDQLDRSPPMSSSGGDERHQILLASSVLAELVTEGEYAGADEERAQCHSAAGIPPGMLAQVSQFVADLDDGRCDGRLDHVVAVLHIDHEPPTFLGRRLRFEVDALFSHGCEDVPAARPRVEHGVALAR